MVDSYIMFLMLFNIIYSQFLCMNNSIHALMKDVVLYIEIHVKKCHESRLGLVSIYIMLSMSFNMTEILHF